MKEILTWIGGHIDTIIAVVSTLLGAFSAIVAYLTFRNTNTIKETVNMRVIQEQYTLNHSELNKLLNQCSLKAQNSSIRPANDFDFNKKMGYILSSLERYLSLNKESADYKLFSKTKHAMEELLSITEVENIQADIDRNHGNYGNLIGILGELLKNGRPCGE